MCRAKLDGSYTYVTVSLKLKVYYPRGIAKRVRFEATNYGKLVGLIKYGKLIRKPSGFYFLVTVAIKREKVNQVKPHYNRLPFPVGVDFGLKTTITLSTGYRIHCYYTGVVKHAPVEITQVGSVRPEVWYLPHHAPAGGNQHHLKEKPLTGSSGWVSVPREPLPTRSSSLQ